MCNKINERREIDRKLQMELVEFERELAQIQDSKEIIDPFRGILIVFLNLMKKNQKNVNM
jgi:hypothetical protein